jgi:ATPase subunit of ABC transporter with duplicated ATPase domains
VIAPADVIGLRCVHSAGKSTLVQMLAGARAPDMGTATNSPPTATIGYLPQQRPKPSTAKYC